MRWNEGGSGEFERPPAGSHLARCYALIDLGSQDQEFQGKRMLKRKVRLMFELPYEKMEGLYKPELKGKPFSQMLQVTQSLHEKSTLRKLLEGWRGKRFDAAGIEAFQPKSLVGQVCRLNLIEGNGGYMNVDGIAPVTAQERKAIPAQHNPSVYISLERDEFDLRAFDSLSDKTKDKIRNSPEWHELQEPEPEQDHGPVKTDQPVDDNIPF
jgi:hypothetical protein